MQFVHVLGDDVQFTDQRLQLDQGPMTGMRLGLTNGFSACFVPLPYPVGIGCERFRRGQFLRFVFRPDSGLCIAEGRNATLRRHAGSGEDENRTCLRQAAEQMVVQSDYAGFGQCTIPIYRGGKAAMSVFYAVRFGEVKPR